MEEYESGPTRIAYESFGPQEGRAIVFLHGATVDHVSMRNTFEPYFRGLNGKHRRVYPDLPGHGASGRSLARATMPALLEDVGAFLRDSFKTPPALVGYSMGGFVALKLAEGVRFPSLFLIAPPVRSNKDSIEKPASATIIQDELTEAERRTADARYLKLAVKRTARTLKKYQSDVAAGFSAERLVFQGRLFRNAAAEDLGIEPGPICSRTTFLVGQQDTLTGFRDQFELSSNLKNSEYHSFYDCGHFLPHECGQFPALFREWLRACGSAAA